MRPSFPFAALATAAACALAIAAPRAAAQGVPGGFAETYALATDRQQALAELVPGTPDYYFYRCLDAQNRGALDEVPALLRAWIDKHGRDQRVVEVENRQALLGFDRDPASTWAFLREWLGLRYDQQRQVPGASPDLPTALDQGQIADAAVLQRALQQSPGSVDALTDDGVRALAAAGVPDQLVRSVLQRLQSPDVKGLVGLVVRELALRDSGGFGALPIHRLLLRAQLDEVAQQRPDVLDDPDFVAAYLPRLLPSADVDLEREEQEQLAWLERLQAFADRLSPVHNWLKARVLYRRLGWDLEHGQLDEARFAAYLRLPRRTAWANPQRLQRVRGNEFADDRGDALEGLQPIGDDEPLVRACFEQLLATRDDYGRYAEFVREDWLRRVFAETRLLLGQGDMERWYALLDDPGYYEQLVQRVDLQFAPTQPRRYDAAAPVSIALDVKNVPTLLLKVYRIDAYTYLRETGKEVDASIDLDGVVANDEQVFEYQEPPLRRVRREFALPQLNGGGTWVVEFVGNGKSSRAVIQKGALTALERLGAAGHVFTVLDERGEPVRDAVAFCAGREFAADEHGEIAVPFAPEARRSTALVLRAGAVATLQRFTHRAESYGLRLAAFVDRESLRAGRKARLLLRPQLDLNGVTIDLDLLHDAVVELAAGTGDGVTTLQTVTAPVWTGDGEYVHEFEVPRELRSLRVTLHGRVDNLSTGRPDDLSATAPGFELNGIDATTTITAPLLGRCDQGWFVEVRGRTGEPCAERAVTVQLYHRFARNAVVVELRTDEGGRIDLGALAGISALVLPELPSDRAAHWLLRPRPLPGLVQGSSDRTLRVPLPWPGAPAPTLVENRDGAPFADATARTAVKGQEVELRQLPAGDYTLRFDAATQVAVRVTAGVDRAGYSAGRSRVLARGGSDAVTVRSVELAGDAVRIALGGATDRTRVHVFASRYLPPFDPLALHLAGAPARTPSVPLAASDCSYFAGRQLSDEQRYVLERRYAAKFPGNMLARPSLLLNPWAFEQRDTSIGVGGGEGGRYGGRGGGRGGGGSVAASEIGTDHVGSGGPAWADLDYLVSDGRLQANLRPAKDGTLSVARVDLGPGQLICVVAVDGDACDRRLLALPLEPLVRKDLTLQRAFAADTHIAEQQRLDVLAGGDEVRIADVTTSRLRTYPTLGSALRLLQAIGGIGDLGEFDFVARWPQLGDDERRALYREHACHELHFFLYHKDRAFFDAVLRPYLASKEHKEFLDDWLLGSDLSGYLEPWRFGRLNLVERILLLQRLPGRGDDLARYVRECNELRPVDLQQLQLGFLGALRSGELDADAGIARLVAPTTAMPQLKDEMRETRSALAAEKSKAPAPAAPPAADAPADRFEAGAVADKETDADDARRRQQTRAFWRGPDATQAFVEHDWWHRRRGEQDPELIAANAFWLDFARAAAGQPFASSHLTQAVGSFTEAMLALAVTDLPFDGAEPDGERAGDALTLRAKGPLLLARSEMLPAGAAAAVDPVLIRQDCYGLDDRYAYDGNQRRQKTVAGAFVRGVGYGSQVVLTNPTEVPRRLSVLLQIPQGAMPLGGAPATRSVPVELSAFATTTLEFAFYWPVAGDFPHYPAQVAADGAFVAAAEAAERHVLAAPEQIDTASWAHVSQLATDDEVLAFLRAQNLQRLDLGRIAWRLRDRAFYDRLLPLLRQRLCFQPELWSFALLHGDRDGGREYLAQQHGFAQQCGQWLDSPLLAIDAEDRRWYEHVEFDPLFHARAHRLGAWQAIQNPAVQAQWQQFVTRLCYRPRLSADDLMAVAYYLFLQGRTDAALAAFDRVDRQQVSMPLQRDYLAAYAAMYRSDTAAARQLAAAHRDHPVERWRRLFGAVLQQLDEATGADVAVVDPADRTDRQTGLAAEAPALEVAVDGGTVAIRYRNVTRCELRYHRLDVEFAFSNSPFAQQGLAAVGWVEPERATAIDVDPKQQLVLVPLPTDLQRGNVVVEVRAGGLARRATSLASAMAVQTVESYGQLEVHSKDGQRPLPGVYVKCYARMPGGAVRFHKDGYTDLRGRFDYASVSDAAAQGAERFALLVLSDRDGAVVREVAPPGP